MNIKWTEYNPDYFQLQVGDIEVIIFQTRFREL
jgi:hypothetical protein